MGWLEAPYGQDSAFDTGGTIPAVHKLVMAGLLPKAAALEVWKRTDGTHSSVAESLRVAL
jgi:hypothetical protein